MYSRKTGTLYNENQIKEKIDSFNSDLRAQYKSHRESTAYPKQQTKNEKLACMTDFGINESVVIAGLILLLLSEENKDYLLIGVLALLLFLNK